MIRLLLGEEEDQEVAGEDVAEQEEVKQKK